MAAVLFRGRSLKGRRLRGRHEYVEESVTLDYSKAPSDNIHEILSKIGWRDSISKVKQLGLFNAFVRFCYRYGNQLESEYTAREVLCCLRVGLLHEAKEIRAAALRAIRYYVQDAASLDALLSLHLDYLIARSLDLCMDNEVERIQALHLIRRIIQLDAGRLPASLVFPVVSVANDGAAEHDKMLRTCLAIICELALQNAALVTRCGGLSAILKNVLQPQHLCRVHESLLNTILSLVNRPITRRYIRPHTDLEQVLAPFTDCHNKTPPDVSTLSARTDKDSRFTASKFAIVTIMRSWPGLIRLCRPDGSGLQSLLGVLYLKNMETRKEIVDIFYDVFRFKTPRWSDSFSDALLSIDPAAMREEWRLQDGFVAEEGKAILPNLAQTRPNLLDNHHALLLSSFISAGLLEALVETITTSHPKVSVRATILLGELLHLANRILPTECSHHSHCLPSLVSLASSFQVPPADRDRASQAVSCLSRLHSLRKRSALPSSLFLDQLLQSSGGSAPRSGRLPREQLANLLQQMPSELQSVVSSAIHDSQVTGTRENGRWDWDLIRAILKWPDESLRKIEDQVNQRFLRRLVHFFKPSSRLYSVFELVNDDQSKCTLAGLSLVDFLLDSDTTEVKRYAEEFLADISSCLEPICAQKASPDALFTPAHLLSTCSQYYFLFLGRMSASSKGERLLNAGIYQLLLNLMTLTHHDVYIKLVVSSLDYTHDGFSRVLLAKGLSSTSETARLYTTSFMRVLLRARVASLSSWALQLLTQQLFDQSKSVAMEALSVLSESCEDQEHLEKLISLSPSVLHLGHKGATLLARFVSVTNGLRQLSDLNYVAHQLEKWYSTLNVTYVQIVEERLSEALTTYEKSYNGMIVRRSHRRQPRKDVFLPIHIYGQLVQNKHGFLLLQKQEYLCELFNTIRHQLLQTEEQILKLKAALWAVGHIGTSSRGVNMLIQQNIIVEIIKLAEDADIFSIRGTAFYVLGLVASTSRGVAALRPHGWEAVRHRHGDLWPVTDDDDDDDDDGDDDGDDDLASSGSSTSMNGGGGSRPSGTPVGPPHPRPAPVPSASPAPSIGSSPRVSFFIEPADGAAEAKSRSDTGSSSAPPFGCSHDSGTSRSSGGPADGLLDGAGDAKPGPPGGATAAEPRAPRADSLTPDTTTSGFSSYESAHHQLTPAADPATVAPPGESARHRRLANVRRTAPPLRRRASAPRPPPLSPRAGGEFSYTSARDSHGYATLKALRKTRASSFEARDDANAHTPSCYGDSAIAKTRSLDFRIARPSGLWQSEASTSLEGATGDLSKVNSTVNLFRRRSAAGRAEFIGIALPLDVSLIFQVKSDDDAVSSAPVAPTTPCVLAKEKLRRGSSLTPDQLASDGLEYHSAATCLGCQRLRRVSHAADGAVDRDSLSEDGPASSSHSSSQANHLPDTLPESLASNTSLDSVSAKSPLTENSKEGRTRIRLDVIQLVIKLISSVGIKSTEQSLLLLKQKFPKAFQDICLYSEICCLLSNYNYSLLSRRFMQEIFQDVDFDALFDEAQQISGLKEDGRKLDVKLSKVPES